jgi:redox-sensing transcriptional repressor
MTAQSATPRPASPARRPSAACLRRMPAYLHLLRALQHEGREYVSGTVLARVHHLEPVIARKDLAETGIVGTPRLGFRIKELIAAIEGFLGWDRGVQAVVVGCGNLGTALLGYRRFDAMGLKVVGAFDCDKRKVGHSLKEYKILPMNRLAGFAAQHSVSIALLTTPTDTAQETAEFLVQCGIRAIWNFAPIKLRLPDDVIVQKEDLAEGLAVLAYRLRLADEASAPVVRRQAAR